MPASGDGDSQQTPPTGGVCYCKLRAQRVMLRWPER